MLPLTDEQFCLAYDIPIEELERKKAERPAREEKDKLWAYVPALWIIISTYYLFKLLYIYIHLHCLN